MGEIGLGGQGVGVVAAEHAATVGELIQCLRGAGGLEATARRGDAPPRQWGSITLRTMMIRPRKRLTTAVSAMRDAEAFDLAPATTDQPT